MAVGKIKKLKVGGIKVSRELAQVDVQWQAGTHLFPSLLHDMAELKINLVYLSISSNPRPALASFCVASADVNAVKKRIDRESDLSANTRIKAPVGSLTVFPHQSSLRLLGCLVRALTQADCPIYGFASSISALTVNTDYRLIDHALTALESVLDLPPHHTPYRQQFIVKQV
jgi:hypothetical protein